MVSNLANWQDYEFGFLLMSIGVKNMSRSSPDTTPVRRYGYAITACPGIFGTATGTVHYLTGSLSGEGIRVSGNKIGKFR